MLVELQAATPPYLYQEILANAGTMQNKGLEIHLSAIPVQTKEFLMDNLALIIRLTKISWLPYPTRNSTKTGYIEDGWTKGNLSNNIPIEYFQGEVGNFYDFKNY